jgi:O-antigen/teichoic acid export membrane protein
MLKRLFSFIMGNDKSVIRSTVYLVTTTILTSALGFVFWTIAARKYPSVEVGIGATFINVVTLVAMLGDMGFGITLMRYVVGEKEKSRLFINTIIYAEIVLSITISCIFALVLPFWSDNLKLLSNNYLHIFLFVLTTLALLLTQLIDNNYIAFDKPHLFFIRNVLSSVIRVVFIYFFSISSGSLSILWSLGVSSVLTLMLSWIMFLPRTVQGYSLKLEFSLDLLKRRSIYALSNQGSQLLYGLTPLLYPLIIIRILGPEANAKFYLCWMIANLLFIIPVSVATSAFAKLSRTEEKNRFILWRSIKLTVLGLLILIPLLILLAPFILNIFGNEYRASAPLLSWLVITALPYSINSFAVVYHRLEKNIPGLLLISGIPAVFSIIFMTIGGWFGSLSGLGMGLCLAQIAGLFVSVKSLTTISRSFKYINKGSENV